MFSFLIAGWVALRFFYAPTRQALEQVQALKVPLPRTLFGGILLVLVAIPLVLYTYNLNQALPLPESLKLIEEQTNESIRGLLQMDNGLELLANLVLIALLPALGEELVFRGIVQRQLMRRLEPWTALLVTAAIFSFIHFQFEGFLPRMVLGFLLGWLYWRTRNLWVPIAAHFVNNGIQVVGQYLYSNELSTVDLEQDIEVPASAALFSVFLVVVLMRWIDRSFKIIHR
ncbi:MAG: CPBP family intramembrane metalloprotease [Bacteroidetes bacterium]|nr:MAG: CPBP family intramembrane metalloprotease [Bacteroidota bacterium]